MLLPYNSLVCTSSHKIVNNRNKAPQKERDHDVVREVEQLQSVMKQSFQLENRHLRDGNDRHLNGRRFHFNHHREPRQGIWGRLRHDADPKRHHHHVNV